MDVMSSSNNVTVQKEVDRSKSCPHLLRLFWKSNRNNPQLEYKAVAHGKFPQNEIQIYTWPDATLREIGDLLKSTVSIARQRNVTLSFELVYPDRNGVHVVRHVGKVSSSRPGPDDDLTLADIRFVIGDYLDVAIIQPQMQQGGGGGFGGGGFRN